MQLGGVAFDCHGWLVPLDGRLEFGKGPERVTAGCRLQRSHRGRKEPVWKAQSSGLKNCTRVQGGCDYTDTSHGWFLHNRIERPIPEITEPAEKYNRFLLGFL